MGQKVHPHGLRVGVIKDWDSRWFAKDNEFGDLLVEDYKIRNYLKKRLYQAGVPAIEIERSNAKIKIFIQCARPGIVIGKGGADIEKLRADLEKFIGGGKKIEVSIVDIKNPDTNACGGKHRVPVGKENFVPPGDEAVNGPRDAYGGKGN